MNDQIDSSTALALYRQMLLIRRFEEKVMELYPEQEMRTPVHLCVGQEAIAAGVCAHLSDADHIFSTHRNHGHCLAKGMPLKSLLAEFYGKKSGCSGGKGGSMHPAYPDKGILGTTAIVGGGIPLATGAAWALAMQKKDAVAVAFFGDGASEEGTFHESLNFAALKKIPVIFVCENNFYATASPVTNRQPAGVTIADRAAGYGMPGFQIDGNDVEEVYRFFGEAVIRARKGEGPTLIEALTYRWQAHVGPVDDTETGHRPKEELAIWKERCPLNRFRQQLFSKEILDNALDSRLNEEIGTELEQSVAFAQASDAPGKIDLLQNVFWGE